MNKSMSRRELGAAAAASVASLSTRTINMEEVPLESVSQSILDSRVSLIEASRGKPFTAAQRKTIVDNLKANDDAWTKCRKEFHVPDQTEPAFEFSPGRVAQAERD